MKEAATQFGWKSHETDWKKLVARPDIDVVDVSTPNNSHAEISIAAAKAGKHVFCEKPLAMSLSEAKEMRDACNQAKVKHMVAFNYRRVPAVAFARQLIQQGKIGKIYHIRAVYLQDWILDPNFPIVWRLDAKTAGSGALGDLGAHILDLAYFLVGEIKAISATMTTFIKSRKELADVTAGLGAAAGIGQGEVTVDDAFAANRLVRFSAECWSRAHLSPSVTSAVEE